jgi:hypothetical protein
MSEKKDKASDFFRRDAASQGLSLKEYCDKYGIDYWDLVGKKRPEVQYEEAPRARED